MRNIFAIALFISTRALFAQMQLGTDPYASHIQFELATREASPATNLPSEPTISLARLRHHVPGKALAAFNRSLRFAKAGAWQKGIPELETALSIDPEFADAHGNLGVHHFKLGHIEQATVEFRRAAELDPASSMHHSNLALALTALGLRNDAEQEAQTAIGLDGTNFRAHYLLGMLLSKRPASHDEAVRHLSYATKELPDAQQVIDKLTGVSAAGNFPRLPGRRLP